MHYQVSRSVIKSCIQTDSLHIIWDRNNKKLNGGTSYLLTDGENAFVGF